MKITNNLEDLYDEFQSSLSANLIIQGPGKVLDLRKQLLKGCVQCEGKISEFMLAQDIACAVTSGTYELKPGAQRLLSGLWNNNISLAKSEANIDGLVRAAGDTAAVLRNLKQADPKKFLEVLVLLWRYQKEKRRGETNPL